MVSDISSELSEASDVELLVKQLHRQTEGVVDYEDIKLVKKIGHGKYGDVWKAYYHDYPVACKILKAKLTERDAESAIREIRLMK